MTKRIIVITLLTMFGTNLAMGDLIPGVTVSSFSSEDLSWSTEWAANTVNGSGLDPSTGIHSTNPAQMWQATSSDATPVIVWDLGAVYQMESMKVWNFNRDSEWFQRHYGAKNVDIYVSIDSDPASASWALVMSPTLHIASLPQNSYNTPDNLNLTGYQARLVKMVIQDTYMADINWWYTGASAGLSEVQFYEVPEPATMSLLGLGGLGVLLRQKRSN